MVYLIQTKKGKFRLKRADMSSEIKEQSIKPKMQMDQSNINRWLQSMAGQYLVMTYL